MSLKGRPFECQSLCNNNRWLDGRMESEARALIHDDNMSNTCSHPRAFETSLFPSVEGGSGWKMRHICMTLWYQSCRLDRWKPLHALLRLKDFSIELRISGQEHDIPASSAGLRFKLLLSRDYLRLHSPIMWQRGYSNITLTKTGFILFKAILTPC